MDSPACQSEPIFRSAPWLFLCRSRQYHRKKRDSQKIWSNGWVYFNHFRTLSPGTGAYPPPELIREAYQKGAALFFPQAFLRVDIGIPVKPDGEDTCALLMVQVKNEEKGHIGNSTSETAKKALNIPTTKLQSSVHVFALFKQKHPDTTEILAAEGPLTVIAVWLDANLYPSAGIKPNNDNQSKGHQEMVLEHLVHFRDALPMSRFSNAMEESEQAEDLLSHLVVMIIPEIKCYYAIRFILPLENQEITIKFHVFYQFLVYYLCKILSKQEQALNSNSVVPVQYPNKRGK